MELANEIVNHDTEIKTYQFKPELQIIEKGSTGEKTSLARVFEEGVQNKIRGDCQRYIRKSIEKKDLLPQISPFQ